MQYEPTLSRAQLIELATKSYFANVDAKNLEAALDCFHDEALFLRADRLHPPLRQGRNCAACSSTFSVPGRI